MKSFRLMLTSLLLSLAFAVPAFAADQVDINTADAATLAAVLDGVGDAKAEAIIAWREANGPFTSIDQLAEVKGIGLKTVEKNRDRIELGAAASEAPQAEAQTPPMQ